MMTSKKIELNLKTYDDIFTTQEMRDVREMSDDEAIITMADANLQRETILPSEKAFAYKMKLDAIKHQGQTYGQVVHKSIVVLFQSHGKMTLK